MINKSPKSHPNLFTGEGTTKSARRPAVVMCVFSRTYVCELKSNSSETTEGRMPAEEELSWDHLEDKG